MTDQNGSLLILSGPSGSGKSTLCRELCAAFDFATLSISTTTRSPREGEKDGEHYFFTNHESFQSAIHRGDFLEWARVHNNLYGTSKSWVESALAADKTIIFDIDVQGQASLKKLYPRAATSVFITTRTSEVLRERLAKRATESADAIETRLVTAAEEMTRIAEYDYLIINDNFETSLTALKSVAIASRLKRGESEIADFTARWNACDPQNACAIRKS
ncbi:MAG: guanylate kinase [Helicobacteraceae bacterium]|jgi:guanylate kinase|nr:guanylate kinase [Helicobacteraceae bacterium]